MYQLPGWTGVSAADASVGGISGRLELHQQRQVVGHAGPGRPARHAAAHATEAPGVDPVQREDGHPRGEGQAARQATIGRAGPLQAQAGHGRVQALAPIIEIARHQQGLAGRAGQLLPALYGAVADNVIDSSYRKFNDIGGGLAASAIPYTGAYTIQDNVSLRIRTRVGTNWSAVIDAVEIPR